MEEFIKATDFIIDLLNILLIIIIICVVKLIEG